MPFTETGISVGITDFYLPDYKGNGGEGGFEPSYRDNYSGHIQAPQQPIWFRHSCRFMLPQRLYFPDVFALFPEKAHRLGLYSVFLAAARATD